jgi:hypothetical protein
MRNLALALGLLVTVSFGAFAITPQKIFEMHCRAVSTHFEAKDQAKALQSSEKCLQHTAVSQWQESPIC